MPAPLGLRGFFLRVGDVLFVGDFEVFDAAGRSEASMLRLWPGLLALAILLNLTELLMRKGRAVVEAFRKSTDSLTVAAQ